MCGRELEIRSLQNKTGHLCSPARPTKGPVLAQTLYAHHNLLVAKLAIRGCSPEHLDSLQSKTSPKQFLSMYCYRTHSIKLAL